MDKLYFNDTELNLLYEGDKNHSKSPHLSVSPSNPYKPPASYSIVW